MRRIIELILVSILSAGIVAWVLISKEDLYSELVVQESAPINKVSYTPESKVDFISSANSAVDQVVHVMSSGSKSVSSPFDFIFGGSPQRVPTMSSGSGVIVSKDGYVITNNHVIRGAENIEVILNNKKSYPAKVIGRDVAIDLALLKIEGDDFSAMPYGDSDQIEIGEWVLAIGNPFNLNSTVTAGIVSAKARSLGMSSRTSLEAFIQTDAAVNPGNSGGALVNTKGELIGINTAIASKTGSYVGYSFAIPVNIVRKVISDLIEFGEVQRALLGVTIYELNAQSAEKLGIENLEGVYVKNVNPMGAAEEAGITIGDVITQIDGQVIRNSSELYEIIGTHRPGDKVKVSFIRNSEKKQLELTLKNKNNKLTMERSEDVDFLGAKFSSMNPIELKKLKIQNGIQITELNPGKLKLRGVKAGFVVVKVNRKRINTVDDIKSVINQSEGVALVEGVYPNGKIAYYAIALD